MVPTAVCGEWVSHGEPPAGLLVPSIVTAVAASGSCQALLLCPQ